MAASSASSPRKNGRRYTEQQIADALRAAGGMTTLAARQLGCDANTIRHHLAKSEALRAIVADSRDELIDIAETALKRATIAGEAWAVCFTLKTVGKHRGYVERQEVTGADGGSLNVNVVYGAETDGGDDAADGA